MKSLLSSLAATLALALLATAVSARPTGTTSVVDAQSLPAGRVGAAYSFQFSAEGGLPPLRWRVVNGSLPPGIALTPDGKLTGTPAATRHGAYAFDVEVTDSSPAAQVAVQRCAVEIAASPLHIVTGGAPALRIVKATAPAAPPADVPATPTADDPPADPAPDGGAGPAPAAEAAPAEATFVAIERKGLTFSSTTVTGRTDPNVALQVFVHRKRDDLGQQVATGKAGADGKFSVTLTNPLLDGDYVTVRAAGAKLSVAEKTEEPVGRIAGQADLYDWGRIRAYFSAGVVFSKENDSFSKNDVGIGFDLDKNWLWANADSGTFRSRINFNTYFDTRLTAIPVTATDPQAGTTTPDPMNGSGKRHRHGPRGTGGDAGGAGDTTDMTDPNETFLASRKAAYFEGGAYLPIGLTNWTYGERNQLFVAPIGKIGFSTITNGQETLEAKIYNGDDVYHFYGAGIRLGHYKLTDDDSTAPELVSYLDIVRGKWENFEGIDAAGNAIPSSGRWGVEGKFRIPLTPMFVGFNANLGEGPDDVRYLFGTRFDIGSLLSKIKGLK